MKRSPGINPARSQELIEQSAQVIFGKSLGELSPEELQHLADVWRESVAIRYENDFQAIVAGMEIP